VNAWPTLALGQVFEIARGGSPRPIEDYITDDPDGINWISISDASESSKFITRTKRRIKPSGEPRSRRVQPGDFLLTNSMSFGRPYIMQTTGCIHDGWLVLRPRREIHADYFYHLLGSDTVYAEFSRLAAGVTVKNLNIDLVSGMKVRVPPVAEQHRIAAILDEADALRAKRRAALAQLDSLAPAIFLDMFGHPVANPKRTAREHLGKLVSIQSGGTPAKERAEYWGAGLPWVSPKDMKVHRITHSIDHVTHRAVTEGGLKRVLAGSILIVVRGMILAHSVPMAIAEREVTINQDMKALRFAASIVPEFGFWCLRAQERDILGDIETASHGTKRLDTDRLAARPILIPERAQQEAFARVITEWESARADMRRHLSAADALFASLQHQAFRGEL
jgi:type I restriction enzyme S subunit